MLFAALWGSELQAVLKDPAVWEEVSPRVRETILLTTFQGHLENWPRTGHFCLGSAREAFVTVLFLLLQPPSHCHHPHTTSQASSSRKTEDLLSVVLHHSGLFLAFSFVQISPSLGCSNMN